MRLAVIFTNNIFFIISQKIQEYRSVIALFREKTEHGEEKFPGSLHEENARREALLPDIFCLSGPGLNNII